MNQAEIIALECENKDRPEMNCNGSCYLSKQLEKADHELAQKKSERSRSLDNLKKIENTPFTLTALGIDKSEVNSVDRPTVSFGYVDSYYFDFCSAILHPPRS